MPELRRRRPLRAGGAVTIVVCLGLVAACVPQGEDREVSEAPQRAVMASPAPPVSSPSPAPTPDDEPEEARMAHERPDWLGTRPLPETPDGFGEVQPTPPELEDRRLRPPSSNEPAATESFTATVEDVPGEIVERSTWSAECPVALEDLRYVTLTFRGFDGGAYTGELLVHAGAAGDLVEVFRRLYEVRFPIEEMRVVAPEELDAPPTGDGNNTTAFVCRPSVGSSSWSQHAYGLAVDINPFHNPYRKGDLVLPELASAYTDRGRHRPGMIQPGDGVTRVFAAAGWGWGGNWQSAKDWMHFSSTGR